MEPAAIEALAIRAATQAAEASVHKAAEEAARLVAVRKEDVEDLVAEAVRQTLTQLGIDNSNPLEMQRDFQHLRQWRKAGEEIHSKGLLTLAGIVITGLCALVWTTIANTPK